jgi:hypothetical protein
MFVSGARAGTAGACASGSVDTALGRVCAGEPNQAGLAGADWQLRSSLHPGVPIPKGASSYPGRPIAPNPKDMLRWLSLDEAACGSPCRSIAPVAGSALAVTPGGAG